MKKFFEPIPDGGFPIYDAEITSVLQKDLWDVIEGTISSLTPFAGIIVQGGAIIDNGATFDIGAGICYLDGQFRRFDASAGLTSPAYINVSAEVQTDTLYADAVSRGYTVDRDAVVEQTSSGVQFITINKDNTTAIYLNTWIANAQNIVDINDARSNERRSRPQMVAKVDAAGNINVNYSLSGTWTVVKIGTGIYELRRNGSLVPNLPVIATAINNSFSAGINVTYDEDNGHVLTTAVTTQSLADWAFRIVAYPEV